MSSLTFDTLKFAQRLELAGATREYAIAEAQALSEVFETGTQDLTTKGDLREMELRTDRKLETINSQITLLKWMVGLSIALSAGMVSLLAKLFFVLPH